MPFRQWPKVLSVYEVLAVLAVPSRTVAPASGAFVSAKRY